MRAIIMITLSVFLLFPLPRLSSAAIDWTDRVKLSTRPLDLTKPPSVLELMSAGQLGGALYPTSDMEEVDEAGLAAEQLSTSDDRSSQRLTRMSRQARQNLSFGHAIQAWNRHDYDHAVQLFKAHTEEFPDSPWVAESLLHIGCDSRYEGRYNEAHDMFSQIIEQFRENDNEGAKKLVIKAKLRMANLKVLQNNFSEARQYYKALVNEATDWRSRTYGSHWLQKLSRLGRNELALLNCGMQALAFLLESDGRIGEARQIQQMEASSNRGQSIDDLQRIALDYGYDLSGLRISAEDLDELPLPAIVQLNGRNDGDGGHYWILENIRDETVYLFDPQSGHRFQQKLEKFSYEWDGITLVFSADEMIPGELLSNLELKSIYGACCGVPTKQDQLGNCGRNLVGGQTSSSGRGAPAWRINVVNMNLNVTDIPLWYTPAIGPAVNISLSYNSQSATAYHEPFGNKWQFNYSSYLVEDTGGNVLIYMPGGQQDQYSPNGSGGYTQPYRNHNILTKIADNHFELRFPNDNLYIYTIPVGTSSLQPFLTEAQDAYGQALNFQYNSNIELATITDALGQVTTLTYNSEGLVTQVADPFGRTATMEYDLNRNLTKITDMGGYWSTLSYDKDVYLTSIANSRETWQFHIEPSDGIVDFDLFNEYSPPDYTMWENYRITITDPLGNKEEFFYYGGGDRFGGGYTWYTSPRYYVPWESFEINNFKIETPKTRYLFTDTNSGQRGEISKTLYPEGDSVSYEYDELTGNRIRSTDAEGNIVQYTYNSLDNVTSIRDAKGTTTTYEYAANEIDLERVTNGLGSVVMTYNGQHDLLTITDRLNVTTAISYNSFGQRMSITEGTGVFDIVSDYTYDPVSHRLLQVARDGNVINNYTYDTIGRRRTFTGPTGVTLTYDYNDLNKITQVTYPDGRYTETNYYECCPGLIESVTERSGQTTSYTYDAKKNLIKTENPEGGITHYQYDANSNLTRFIDTNANPTSFAFDSGDSLIRKTYADGRETERTYNSRGTLEKLINGRGLTKTLTYDKNYNLTASDYSDDTPDVAYQYDEYDRLISVQDGLGVTSYAYDDNSRLLSIDGPWPNDTLSIQYDLIGRRTDFVPELGDPVRYTYDTMNRLTEVEVGARSYSYGYTGVNPLVAFLSRPNASTTSYQYDNLNRLLSISNQTSADAVITQNDFTYNLQDLRDNELVTNNIPATVFEEQLVTYDYNTSNQLLEKSDILQSFLYDDDGNIVQGYTLEGFVFTAKYDAENRLKSVEYTDADTVVRRIEFHYSANDFLKRKLAYEDSVLVDDTRYIRHGALLNQERGSLNNVIREYYWGIHKGGGIGGLLELQQGSSEFYYLYDGKGNVSGLLDSSQSIVQSYTYSPFGTPLTKSGSIDQPFRFSTKEFDEQTGLSYYGYRFYSPGLSRWINRDPIQEFGGINLYGYVGNDPVNMIDFYGERAIPIEPYPKPGSLTDLLQQLSDIGPTIDEINLQLKKAAKAKDDLKLCFVGTLAEANATAPGYADVMATVMESACENAFFGPTRQEIENLRKEKEILQKEKERLVKAYEDLLMGHL